MTREKMTFDALSAETPASNEPEYQLIKAAVGERGMTDASTPLYVRVQNLVELWDVPFGPGPPELVALVQAWQEADIRRRDLHPTPNHAAAAQREREARNNLRAWRPQGFDPQRAVYDPGASDV